MWMFTLAISRLIMCSLPWFMDLTCQVPVQYCSLQHWITTRHLNNWASFPLWSSGFILSGAISNYLPLFPISILNTFWPWGAHLPVLCLFVLSYRTVHGVLVAKIFEWFAIPSSSGPCFVRTLHYDSSILGDAALHGLSLHWVMQAPLPGQGWDPWRE